MRIRAREAAEHAGAMVAVYLGSDAAAQVAVPGGEPATDLHVTLAFLGDDVAQLDTTVDQVAEVLTAVAADRPPLTGSIAGAGRFIGTDGTDAVWSAVDVVGLDELRVAVVAALEAAGIPVDTTHGFTPHVTVAYVPTGADAPATTTDPVEISFDELTLAWADARTTYALGGAMKPTSRSTEAFPGDRTYGDVRALLEKTLTERFGGERIWIWVRDLTDTEAIYTIEADTDLATWTVGFTIAEDGAVTLAEPVEVEARTTYEPIPAPANTTVTEARQHLVGRVVEAKGTDSATGGRIFGVEILQYGTSKNGVRYTESVMAAATGLYEGAKVFDHHRTAGELASSTVAGLAGGLRNVEATASALTADLHLLPSATHIAEAFDASLEAQAAGLPPLVGMSHDVALSQREATEGTRKIKEATAIHTVFSVDVVADPSAGGRVTRTVAGGICDTQLPEEITMTTLAELLEGASDEDKAAFRSLLGDAPTSTTTTATPDPAATTATTEGTTYTTAAPLGRLLIETAVKGAQIDERLTESIVKHLGDRFTEADLVRTIETAQAFAEPLELDGLTPRTPAAVKVTKEAQDKKIERLDRTLEGNFGDGYPSIRLAYADLTGATAIDMLDAELPFRILRESAQHSRYEGMRQTESVTTATWGQIFADALHRRLVAVYKGNDFQAWRDLVSTITPRMDFRTNHIVRMGGYGVLPTVAEGDPYTALTSPPDEEATYTLAKKGGTEDLTLEAIANDDMGAVRRIPQALARAAALTLYRFVIDTLFASNPTVYDGVALFATGHANTTATAPLDRDNLAAVRTKMRKQAAYGVAADVLGLVPKFLWVPADLERTAWELCTSAVAVTAGGDATIPNINQNMVPRVVDHWTDANDWFVTADPNTVETIELGFFNGKQDPELFVQDDPKTGAVFTNDKITWKIRHIYAGAVADYRGFQRATNA